MTGMAMNAGGRGIRLRPLEIGDVLDETFQVYRRGFVPIITVMAIVVVPTALLSLIVVLITGIDQSSVFDRLSVGASIAAVAAIFVFAIVAGLAQLVASGAAVRVAADVILGQPINIGDAYRETLSRLGSLLLVSICVGVPLSLLVVTCIGIPVAIFVGLGWSLVFPAILLEGRGAIDAMRRSWELVDGHRWRLLVCLVLIGLIVWLLVSIPTGLFVFAAGILVALSDGGTAALMGMQVGNVLFQAAGQTLFGAIGLITTTLLYYDLRIRKEAFDLQQRIPQAEIPRPPGYQQHPPYPGQAPQYPPQTPPPPPAPGYPPPGPEYPPQSPPGSPRIPPSPPAPPNP
jgi:Membrane domain of glycerophosphoryl diester phosphodiesterase